jgi:hypothetical protein
LTDQVRRLAALGVDAIKAKDPVPPMELLAAADVARGLGLPVFGHVWAGDEPPFRAADAPGAYDGVSHLYSVAPAAIRAPELVPPPPDSTAPLDERRIWNKSLWLAADSAGLRERIAALVSRPSWLEPLLVNEENFVRQRAVDSADAPFASFPSVRRRLGENRVPSRAAEDQRRLERALARLRGFVREFHEAGGMLVAGTDNAPIPGISLHQELEALVTAGLPPADAIAAGTRNAAIALHAADRLGTIEVGKLADLVILTADPRADIRHTRRVWRVVKAGVVHDPAPLLASLGREGRSIAAASAGGGWSRKRLAAGAALLVALLAGALFVAHSRRRGSLG